MTAPDEAPIAPVPSPAPFDGGGESRSAVTLHDVAREAGVSLATASRSLNGSSRKVAEAYRERVIAAAERLNYTPNLSAQAVARGSSRTVALLVADIADPYFSTIASGVVAAADAAGLIVTMAATDRDPARELELVRTMRGQRPRVMILAGSRRVDDPLADALRAELEAFEQTGGRVVVISTNDLAVRTVLVGNAEGARDLAVALADLGYRRFAVLAGIEGLLTSEDRLRGFVEGLSTRGIELDPDAVVRTPFTRDGGYSGMQRLLATGRELDLVFAVNDVMAVGALAAVRDAGLVAGVDLGIAGFDDIPTVRDVTPPLSTVAIPLVDVGRRALALALDDPQSNGALANAAQPISTTVVLRESTPSRR